MTGAFLRLTVLVHFHEALKGLTVALVMASAAVSHVTQVPSDDALARWIGALFRVGNGSGDLIGGMLVSAAGAF